MKIAAHPSLQGTVTTFALVTINGPLDEIAERNKAPRPAEPSVPANTAPLGTHWLWRFWASSHNMYAPESKTEPHAQRR